MTDFRALNNFARVTGEALKEKVDLAMTSDILQMRFAHYLGEFADDEGFLQATYQAGLQVERMKALEKTREAARPTSNPWAQEKKKVEKRRNPSLEKPAAGGRKTPAPAMEEEKNLGTQVHGDHTKQQWKESPGQNKPTTSAKKGAIAVEG